jgi:hypothetical protein
LASSDAVRLAAACLALFALGACAREEPPRDEAWSKRSVEVLLGRKPRGMREVRAIADLVRATDRRTVARVLMGAPEFERRWSDWLLDELQIDRLYELRAGNCWLAPRRASDGDHGELAAFLRDHDPTDAAPGGEFGMADVVRSSLRLDDLTPVYRANLFAMLRTAYSRCINVPPIENDLVNRRTIGAMVNQIYAHRNLDCAPCHNADYSTTFSADPATNRFWPIPGEFEAALYGSSGGRPPDEFYAPFRRLGVVHWPDTIPDGGVVPGAQGVEPWNLHALCGQFEPASAIPPDDAVAAGYFLEPMPSGGSVWDVEAALHRGIEALDRLSPPYDPVAIAAEPDPAFAFLLAVRVAHQAWLAVMGAPLTVAHGFPRNPAQRDTLRALAERLIASRWSLRALLEEIVADPLYDLPIPTVADGDPAGYALPAVLQPFATYEEDPAARANSVGDGIHRGDARMLLDAASEALGWPLPDRFPSEGDSYFEASIGVATDALHAGFAGLDFQSLLAWEGRMAACLPPMTIRHDDGSGDPSSPSCAGRCDRVSDFEACGCDRSCEILGDCCADYAATCLADARPPADWIDALGDAAATEASAHPESPPTVRDAVSALKDRLITQPQVEADEEAAVAALVGAPSLDTPLGALPGWKAGLRRYCGALLETPDFLLSGMPATNQPPPPPRLVVGQDRYRDHCERLAALAAPVGVTVRCSDDGLQATRAAGP